MPAADKKDWAAPWDVEARRLMEKGRGDPMAKETSGRDALYLD